MTLWLAPLLLLPGVGLLIMSTSARYSRLHDEIHYVVHQAAHNDAHRLPALLERGRLFRNALVLLYVCIGLFALAGLAGVVLQMQPVPTVRWVVLPLMGTGIASLFGAAVALIRESIHSLDVMRAHREDVPHANSPQDEPEHVPPLGTVESTGPPDP